MAPAFQNTLTFNHSKLWDNLFSEFGNCSVTAAKKKPFFPRFLVILFCHLIRKPSWQTTYTIGELGSRRFFFALGCWVSSTWNQKLEFLQRYGTQIRVTGLYWKSCAMCIGVLSLWTVLLPWTRCVISEVALKRHYIGPSSGLLCDSYNYIYFYRVNLWLF